MTRSPFDTLGRAGRGSGYDEDPAKGGFMLTDQLKRYASLANLIFALSLILFVWVIWYC